MMGFFSWRSDNEIRVLGVGFMDEMGGYDIKLRIIIKLGGNLNGTNNICIYISM